MKTVSTWTSAIYVGRYCIEENKLVSESRLRDVCQKYCDENGFCVTFTPTTFIYTKDHEPGAIVGLIHYPRFPADVEVLETRALELAKRLLKVAKQKRVSVVFPKRTVMLENSDL